MKENIINFLKEQEICLNKTLNQSEEILKIIKIIMHARDTNKKIFTMGNGGSGSTASHFVSDLLKTAILTKGNRFQAFSLVDNVSVILAWSNDSSYDEIFSEQLKNSLTKGDVIIAFSGSGNSKNIIKAFQYGKKIGARCIGFTGKDGGKIKKYCDECFKIPSNDMLTIESQHVVICHCIISFIRKTGTPLFKYS